MWERILAKCLRLTLKRVVEEEGLNETNERLQKAVSVK